jgi:hypothetical protein
MPISHIEADAIVAVGTPWGFLVVRRMMVPVKGNLAHDTGKSHKPMEITMHLCWIWVHAWDNVGD